MKELRLFGRIFAEKYLQFTFLQLLMTIFGLNFVSAVKICSIFLIPLAQKVSVLSDLKLLELQLFYEKVTDFFVIEDTLKRSHLLAHDRILRGGNYRGIRFFAGFTCSGSAN